LVLCSNRKTVCAEVVAVAIFQCRWKLARQLYATQPGDVVVADSAYGTYVDLALVHSANADAVFGNIMRVTVIFVGARSWALAIILSNGSVLGDVLNQCLQKTLEHYQQASKCGSPFIDSTTGVSTHRNHLVTTLVDPKRYPKAKLAHLYLRWQATEVNFKHLKTTLKMEMILPKPEMVQKEIWMHLLAYNLLRSLMWQSAIAGVAMSLQGARQQFNQFRPGWLRQPPKTVVASTQPCSMSSVINSFPCVLIGQNRESPKEDPRVFPECSNLAPSSKLSWSLV